MLPCPPVPPIVSDNAKNMVKAAELLETSFYLGCSAHTLNLAAQKALQLSCVSNLLAKVKKIVAFFHRSAIGATALKTQTDLLGLPNHKLIIDVATRWNSAYDMLTKYLESQVTVTAVVRNKNLGNSTDKTLKDLKTLTDDEVAMAEDIVKCLRPLKTITSALCTESVPTISIILPLKDQLCNKFLQPKEEDSPCERNEDDLAVASALDPRFKRLPFLTEDEKDNCLKTIISAIVKTVNSVQVNQVKVEPNDENSQTCQPLPVLPSVLESHGVSQSSASVITGTGNETEKPKLCADNPTDGFADFLGEIHITAVENAPTADEKANQDVNKYRQMPPVAVFFFAECDSQTVSLHTCNICTL